MIRRRSGRKRRSYSAGSGTSSQGHRRAGEHTSRGRLRARVVEGRSIRLRGARRIENTRTARPPPSRGRLRGSRSHSRDRATAIDLDDAPGVMHDGHAREAPLVFTRRCQQLDHLVRRRHRDADHARREGRRSETTTEYRRPSARAERDHDHVRSGTPPARHLRPGAFRRVDEPSDERVRAAERRIRVLASGNAETAGAAPHERRPRPATLVRGRRRRFARA